jgi:hypothetical protein
MRMSGHSAGWKRWFVGGAVLMALSRGFEAMGDAAPFVEDGGIAGERLMYHGLALVLLIAGAGCGVRVLARLIRSLMPGAADTPGAVARVFADGPVLPQAPAEFDPDEAFARYMARKAAQEADAPPAAPVWGGFGRKGA